MGEADRKASLKEIILALHHGLSIEAAKERFEKEIGDITSREIAQLEQALINEGTSPDEIKKFCNVHALLFEKSLSKQIATAESPAHPVSLFKAENREIEKITAALKDLIAKKAENKAIAEQLEKLREVDLHYVRKEQLLFPFLEKHGFPGPSKVMWGKDNEVRDLLKQAIARLGETPREEYVEKYLRPALDEIEGMIFKEENILFPTSLEMLTPAEWIEILKESGDVGYVYIEQPAETLTLEELERSTTKEVETKKEEMVTLPTGEVSLKELMWALNSLPVDISFVDKNDEVRYFNDTKDRIFVRTKTVIGRKVQNCHPPKSLDVVEKIINSFRSGKKSKAEFWLNLKGRLVLVRYFAVRDESRHYLGTLEVTQDITDIKKLEGERRLLSD
ncbi:hypothetical protein A2625_06895 [candidate division WOR-1 bacterium RIFCSPHIGHO2_01_FULL_53_15]|uniref:Histidine kinase n=1 Tax=candidate division WOR-1 bacterium RIFCSPHIGHO2_01_FULL_53_15 TaxID=1802564 RepID=A0A1F4Q4Y1_UNCSA|nr:MAG: hypothetical protein A2625_06895 [candidate division WOR-1 bacterium RIFCSPHIGHO2_01_FULL_53_15]OGC10332.1 MAG: hypothetical protein A3D23_06920 [candidate division WOR-1 bacterium RIFCSPHIGHO2_02_FULL_53_26]